jgi:deazaflavin-dependent oxidoreductase (nitroreductase family)
MTLESGLARLSVCDLETIGRVSGQPRRIEIWFAADSVRDRIYLLAGGRDDAQWVRNLRANPSVRVFMASQSFSGIGTVIEGGPDDDLVRRSLAAKYQGWSAGKTLSSWARDSLPVAIDLQVPDRTASI